MNQIDNVLNEDRLFPPSPEFVANASIDSMRAYEELYDRAKADPVAFWSELAREELHWFQDFKEGLVWNEPYAEWFVGGKTNMSYNCLDVHLQAEVADRTAFIWEGEPGDVRTFTYRELHAEVCKFANVLKGQGIGVGDVVSIYMPMVPELSLIHI